MTIGLVIYWIRQSLLVAGFLLAIAGVAAFDWRVALIAAGLAIGGGAAMAFRTEGQQ